MNRLLEVMADRRNINFQQVSILDDNTDINVTNEEWWRKLGQNDSSIAPASLCEDGTGAELDVHDIIENAFLPDSCDGMSPIIPETMNDNNKPLFSTPNISLESNFLKKKFFGKFTNRQSFTPLRENKTNVATGGLSTLVDDSFDKHDKTMPPPPAKKNLVKPSMKNTEFIDMKDEQVLQQNITRHSFSDIDITMLPPLVKKRFFKPRKTSTEFKDVVMNDEELLQNKTKNRFSGLVDIVISPPLVKKTFFNRTKTSTEFKDNIDMNDEQELRQTRTSNRFSDINDVTIASPLVKKTFFKPTKTSAEFKDISDINNDEQNIQPNRTVHFSESFRDSLVLVTVATPLVKKSFFKSKTLSTEFKDITVLNDKQELSQNEYNHHFSVVNDIAIGSPLVKKTFFKARKTSTEFNDITDKNEHQELQQTRNSDLSDIDVITNPSPLVKKTFFEPRKTSIELKAITESTNNIITDMNVELDLQQNRTGLNYNNISETSILHAMIEVDDDRTSHQKNTSQYKRHNEQTLMDSRKSENNNSHFIFKKGYSATEGTPQDEEVLVELPAITGQRSNNALINVSDSILCDKTLVAQKKTPFTKVASESPINNYENLIVDNSKLNDFAAAHTSVQITNINKNDNVSVAEITRQKNDNVIQIMDNHFEMVPNKDEEIVTNLPTRDDSVMGNLELGQTSSKRLFRQKNISDNFIDVIQTTSDQDTTNSKKQSENNSISKLTVENITRKKFFINGKEMNDNLKNHDDLEDNDTMRQDEITPEQLKNEGNSEKPNRKQLFDACKNTSRFVRQYEAAILDSSESENDSSNMPKFVKSKSRASSLSSRMTDYYDDWQLLLPSSTMIQDDRQSVPGSTGKRSRSSAATTDKNPLNRSKDVDSPKLYFSNKNNQSAEVMRQCKMLNKNSWTEKSQTSLNVTPGVETSGLGCSFSQNEIVQVLGKDVAEFSLPIEDEDPQSPLRTECSLEGNMHNSNMSQTTIDRMFEEEFRSKRTNPPVRRSSVRNIDGFSGVDSQLEESIPQKDNSNNMKYLNKTSAENTALSQSEIERAFVKKSQKLRSNPPVRHSMAPATLKDTSPHSSKTSQEEFQQHMSLNISDPKSILNDESYVDDPEKNDNKSYRNENIDEKCLQDCKLVQLDTSKNASSEVKGINQITELENVDTLSLPEFKAVVENVVVEQSALKDISEIKDNKSVEISLENCTEGQSSSQLQHNQRESLSASIANGQENVLDKETKENTQNQSKLDYVEDPECEEDPEDEEEPVVEEDSEDEEEPEVEEDSEDEEDPDVEEEENVSGVSNGNQSEQEMDSENEEKVSSEEDDNSNGLPSKSIEPSTKDKDEAIDIIKGNASHVNEDKGDEKPPTAEATTRYIISSQTDNKQSPQIVRKDYEDECNENNKENNAPEGRHSSNKSNYKQEVPQSLATENEIGQCSSIFEKGESSNSDSSKKRASSTVMLEFEPNRKVIKCDKITDPIEIQHCLQRLRMDLAEKNKQAKENVAQRFNPENRKARMTYRYKCERPAPGFLKKKTNETKKKPVIIIGGQIYKKPKLYKPGVWATKKLYLHLKCKLQVKYGKEAEMRSVQFVRVLHEVIKHVMNDKSEPSSSLSWELIEGLKIEMASLAIIRTHFDFYIFVEDFMTRAFRYKAIPNMLNGFKLPEGGINQPILEDGAVL